MATRLGPLRCYVVGNLPILMRAHSCLCGLISAFQCFHWPGGSRYRITERQNINIVVSELCSFVGHVWTAQCTMNKWRILRPAYSLKLCSSRQEDAPWPTVDTRARSSALSGTKRTSWRCLFCGKSCSRAVSLPVCCSQAAIRVDAEDIGALEHVS